MHWLMVLWQNLSLWNDKNLAENMLPLAFMANTKCRNGSCSKIFTETEKIGNYEDLLLCLSGHG